MARTIKMADGSVMCVGDWRSDVDNMRLNGHRRLFYEVFGTLGSSDQTPVTRICASRLMAAREIMDRLYEISCGCLGIRYRPVLFTGGENGSAKHVCVRVVATKKLIHDLGIPLIGNGNGVMSQVREIFDFPERDKFQFSEFTLKLGCPHCADQLQYALMERFHNCEINCMM